MMIELRQTWSFKLVLQCLCWPHLNGGGGTMSYLGHRVLSEWHTCFRYSILPLQSLPRYPSFRVTPPNGPDIVFLFLIPTVGYLWGPQFSSFSLISGVRMSAPLEIPEALEAIWFYHGRGRPRQLHATRSLTTDEGSFH